MAIDVLSKQIMGKMSIHTTHSSADGVSEGIVKVLSSLIQRNNINTEEIELISHSTTQAVNALLEGDVAKVGVVGMGVGLEKSNVIKRTNIKDIPLGSDKFLKTCYAFLDTSKYLEESDVKKSIENLVSDGAKSIVVSEAFGVDNRSNEIFVMRTFKIAMSLPDINDGHIWIRNQNTNRNHQCKHSSKSYRSCNFCQIGGKKT